MMAGVVLAAGDSARMGGRPKALLPYKGSTFIETVCAGLRGAGITDITVVLGRQSELILSAWNRRGERVAVNPRPEEGQLSSLQAALRAVSPGAGAVMLALVDQPAVAPGTYKALRAAYSGEDVLIAKCGPKRGHPIVLGHRVWPLVMRAPLSGGLHWVTHHPDVKVSDLRVDDSGVIRDVDTPEDFRRLSNDGA